MAVKRRNQRIILNFMGNGITIIVGAGAVLDFNHKGVYPSVDNITDEVLKLSIQKVDGGERPLLRELYDHVVRKLNRVLEAKRIMPPKLNFENLFHVIEMCIAYSSFRGKEYISMHAFALFTSFTTITFFTSQWLSDVVSTYCLLAHWRVVVAYTCVHIPICFVTST